MACYVLWVTLEHLEPRTDLPRSVITRPCQRPRLRCHAHANASSCLRKAAARQVGRAGKGLKAKSQSSGMPIVAKSKTDVMPEKKTIDRARKAKRQGKSPGTQAGEFVREEIEHIREGKHGARSAKQAIAIGLSKARRAGVDLKPPKKGEAPADTITSAKRAYEKGQKHEPISRARSRAGVRRLKREGSAAASRKALSRQAHAAARKRTASERSESAKQAAKTKGPRKRSDAARKAARTRARERNQ